MLLVQGLKLCPILRPEIAGMPLLLFFVFVGRGHFYDPFYVLLLFLDQLL